MLGFFSRWYFLMQQFPDWDEKPILQLKWQSGTMRFGVRMGGILRISVCPSGLRIGMLRVFGLFCRDFFVPWARIRVARKNCLFWQLADLKFGNSKWAKLAVSAGVADQIARAAAG